MLPIPCFLVSTSISQLQPIICLFTTTDQGQGAAQAIEDAAALGALLDAQTTPEQVTERLRVYHDVRYDHSVTVMFMSRVMDTLRESVMDDLKQFVPKATFPENMFEYCWDSYPAKDAERTLRSSLNRQAEVA